MRKLLLISTLLLASASAHAGPRTGMELAAADTPAATAPDPTAQPLPPVTDSAKNGNKDSPKPQVADAPRSRAAKPRSHVRRYEGDEAKARRIAAKYGISW